MMKLSNVFIKLAIDFISFECFCPFLSLIIITGQQNVLSFADGLHYKTPGTKNCISLLNLENFLISFYFSFLYEFIANKAGKQSRISSWKIFAALSMSVGISLLLFDGIMYYSH